MHVPGTRGAEVAHMTLGTRRSSHRGTVAIVVDERRYVQQFEPAGQHAGQNP
jgi:hypothetical protein